jgi:hypothetical protein
MTASTQVDPSLSGRLVRESGASFIRLIQAFRFEPCEGAQFDRWVHRLSQAGGRSEQAVDHSDATACQWRVTSGDALRDRFREWIMSPQAIALAGRDQGRPRRRLAWIELDSGWLESAAGHGFGRSMQWEVRPQGKYRSAAIPVQFRSLQVMLGEAGIGYLIWELGVESENLDDWVEALHACRLYRNRRESGFYVTRRTGPGTSVSEVPGAFRRGMQLDARSQSERRDAAQAGLSLMDAGAAVLWDLAQHGPSGIRGTQQWWRKVDSHHALRAYAAFTIVAAATDANDRHRLLYRISELAPTTRPLHAAAEDLAPDRASLSPYADGVQFVATREMCAYVAFDPPGVAGDSAGFFRRGMPSHLRDRYQWALLLTLYQKHALESLREAVVLAEDHLHDRAHLHRLRERAAVIRSAVFMVETMTQSHHVKFEQFLRQVMQLDRVYELTSGSMDDIDEFAERAHERWRRAFGRITSVVAGGFTLVLACLAFLSVNIREITTEREGMQLVHVLVATGLVFVMGIGLALGSHVLFDRPQKRDRAERRN